MHRRTTARSSRRKAIAKKPRDLLALLEGGDRRSIGRADEAAKLAEIDPRLFKQLIRGLWTPDAVVRMRAADAAEKASRRIPELLRPFKTELLGLLAETTQQELRWHLAQMVPRFPLTAAERRSAVTSFQEYLSDTSSIVRIFAMQALADFAETDEKLRVEVVDLIRVLSRTGTPAMRARGRKLLAHLERLSVDASSRSISGQPTIRPHGRTRRC
jgi:hypothetical protein